MDTISTELYEQLEDQLLDEVFPKIKTLMLTELRSQFNDSATDDEIVEAIKQVTDSGYLLSQVLKSL